MLVVRPVRTALVVAGVCWALSGCSQPVQPRVEVACIPTKITVTFTNVDQQPARYTAQVEIRSEGVFEQEQYSTNVVHPGQTVTISDMRPHTQEQCRVTGVRVFAP